MTDPLEVEAILSVVSDAAEGAHRGPSPEERRAVFIRFLRREGTDRPVVLAVDDVHRGEAAMELGRDLARERGYEVVERTILPEELARTQEIFLTGTAVEVTPVSEIDEYRFTPGQITQELMTAYDELVQRPHRKTAEIGASAA